MIAEGDTSNTYAPLLEAIGAEQAVADLDRFETMLSAERAYDERFGPAERTVRPTFLHGLGARIVAVFV